MNHGKLLTPTQFAWSVLGMGRHPPPQPKRGPQYGASPLCWLCGGETNGEGWPREVALPVTFASHNEAACQSSDAICEACAAFAGGDTWQRYVRERAPDVKTWGQASWRSYGHFFAAPDRHECPKPSRWREILLAPPAPPFLCIISLTGQKNLIFRGQLALSRDVFPVLLEEELVVIDRGVLRDCLADVERALAAGLSRDGIRSGRFHYASAQKVGLRQFEHITEMLRRWRMRHLPMLEVALYCAARPDRPDATEDA